MMKRIGNVTIATVGARAAVYCNNTPYRTTGIGFLPFCRWRFGWQAREVFATVYALGPFVLSFVDVGKVGKRVQS